MADSRKRSHEADVGIYPRPGVPVTEDQLESIGDRLDQLVADLRREIEREYDDLVEVEVTVVP